MQLATRTLAILGLIAVTLCLAHPTSAAQVPFLTLPSAGSGVEASVSDISANGSVLVGTLHTVSTSGNEAFRWTSAGGFVRLGGLSGVGLESFGNAVSGDGLTVVGDSNSTSGPQAFRWTSATGMVGLGDLPGGSFASSATSASANGSVIVGVGTSANGSEAFRWTAPTGLVPLGDLPGGAFSSYAGDVSADGSAIVGHSNSGFDEAFLWTAAGGMIGLGDLNPDAIRRSGAEAISANGAVVVGNARSLTTNFQPFRWTQATGMLSIDLLPGVTSGVAADVSADGSTIVGSNGAVFIWDSTNGLRNLQDVLTGYGVNLTGWTLESATAISADGTTIVGTATNPSGLSNIFIATIPEPALLPLYGMVAFWFARRIRRRLAR